MPHDQDAAVLVEARGRHIDNLNSTEMAVLVLFLLAAYFITKF
jgi:hypothetical protein